MFTNRHDTARHPLGCHMVHDLLRRCVQQFQYIVMLVMDLLWQLFRCKVAYSPKMGTIGVYEAFIS